MKNILLIVAIFLIITWPGGDISRPKVSADDFIFEPDSLAVASLMTMISVEGVIKPDVIPKPPSDCNCKGGKVSYDGGRSLSTCPCGVNGGKCNCADCPYNKTGEIIQTSIENTVNYDDYYILKVTAPWCGPCKIWDANVKPSFEKINLIVKDLDYDTNPSMIKDALIDKIPYFVICTKVDNIYHKMPLDKFGQGCGVYGAGSSAFSVETAKNLIAELDNKLHPAKINGIYYIRQQEKQTKLNGSFWASKTEYIRHLKEDSNHKNDITNWPLENLSVYELKAIHDDDHADKLGVLYGI